MPENPVVKNYAYCLIHAPDLVRYGSKPRREIAKNGEVEEIIRAHLRSPEEAENYPPNQVFIGNLTPEELGRIPQPWYKLPFQNPLRLYGPFGEIVEEEIFYILLKLADILNPPLFEIKEIGRAHV